MAGEQQRRPCQVTACTRTNTPVMALAKNACTNESAVCNGAAPRWPRRWRAQQRRLPRCSRCVRDAALTSACRTGANARCQRARSTAARLELQSLDFFSTSSNCTSSRTRVDTSLALFVPKRFDATSITRAQSHVRADSAGTSTQQHLFLWLQLTLSAKTTGPSPASDRHPRANR